MFLLGVLKLLNQIQLHLLHASNFSLPLQSQLVFTNDLLLELSSSLHSFLLFNLASLLLNKSFLVPHHLLDALVFQLLLLSLHLNELLLLSFVVLELFRFHLDLDQVLVFSSLNVLFHLLLHGVVLFHKSLFFESFLLPTLFPFSVQLSVSLPLLDDLLRLLLGLLNLLPSFVFFHLEQLDPVGQELGILFSSLPRSLGFQESLALVVLVFSLILVIVLLMLLGAVLFVMILVLFLHR